jgi:deoxycytidylate deaminase
MSDARPNDPQLARRGPCAKRQVICIITTLTGEQFRGENDCANPQAVCPRLPGEGYEKCKSICQQAGHAEIEALKAAGEHARGATAQLWGHYWMCEPCGRALLAAGVGATTIYPLA